MTYRNASTAKEILQLRREIEALKESMRPPMRWVEVVIEEADEVPEAPENCHLLVNIILATPAQEPEILPPEYTAIADSTAVEREREAEEFARVTKPRRRILPPDERPFSLNYPKGQ